MGKSKFLILIVINVLIVGIAFFFLMSRIPKIGYVNTANVYNEFTYKKELEVKFKNTENAQKKYMDSLAFKIRLLNNEIQTSGGSDKGKMALFETKREEYLSKQKEYSQQSSALTEQYSAQIWKQLNQYMKDYGNKYNYTFILGGNGTGTLMHASDANDITKDVQDYVNKKYKGGE